MVSKPNHVIAKDVKMYLVLLYQIRDIDSMIREMLWSQTGATQIGLPDKVRAIKVLVVVVFSKRSFSPIRVSSSVFSAC